MVDDEQKKIIDNALYFGRLAGGGLITACREDLANHGYEYSDEIAEYVSAVAFDALSWHFIGDRLIKPKPKTKQEKK